MFSCKSFVHASNSTEFTAHTAGITVVVLRKTVVADRFGCLRVEGAGKLCIPVKNTACISHLVIDISGVRDTFGDICRMGCDLGSDDSLFNIINIRKCPTKSKKNFLC